MKDLEVNIKILKIVHYACNSHPLGRSLIFLIFTSETFDQTVLSISLTTRISANNLISKLVRQFCNTQTEIGIIALNRA